MLAAQNGHLVIAQLLLNEGVRVEPRSPYQPTALNIAKENGKEDMIELLTRHMGRSHD